MANLITTAYAKEHIAQTTYTAGETTTIDNLVVAVSKAIKMFCNREFDSQTFDEVYDGQVCERIQLRQYPIISIDRFAAGRTAVLETRNNSATVQRATIHTTTTTAVLNRVIDAVTTTNTITFADVDSNTLGELVTKIDTVANGWDARLTDSTLSGRASADLMPQGVYDAKDIWAQLYLHIDEYSSYQTDYPRGWLISPNSSWGGGPQEFRVKYTAGFVTVPADVQTACAKWIANLWWATKTTPQAVPILPNNDPPLMVNQLLSCWRRHSF